MKDYQEWTTKKHELEKQETVPDFTERDIWWCSIGLNIGFEEDGKNEEFERPVFILRKFNKDLFMGLPLTSTCKGSPFYFSIELHGMTGSILLSQARVFSAKRLRRRMARLPETTLVEIREQYKQVVL